MSSILIFICLVKEYKDIPPYSDNIVDDDDTPILSNNYKNLQRRDDMSYDTSNSSRNELFVESNNLLKYIYSRIFINSNLNSQRNC